MDRFDATLRQLLVFINAFISLNKQNRVIVIAMHCDGCHYLYESPEFDTSESERGDFLSFGSLAEPIQEDACSRIIPMLLKLTAKSKRCDKRQANTPSEQGSSAETPLATALSMAMCYSNRCQLRNAVTAGLTRILCIKGSSDTSSQYIPIMNAIFSAQRSGIPIDSCLLGESVSNFLQQAAHITGGSYFKAGSVDVCLQKLLALSAADRYSRALLRLPKHHGIDFCASCFCHKQPLDAGFVCSLCLSIYCGESSSCSTCRAGFQAIL